MNPGSPAQHPRLRPLDIRPHAQNGHPYLLLRDPLQLTDSALLVPQPLAAVLAYCDGETDAAGIAHAFHAEYGFPVGLDLVHKLLAALDQAYFLDNARAAAALEQARADFRAAPARPPRSAGASYPADPDDLHASLEAYRQQARGATPLAPLTPTPRFGLLSPHIDYPRGGTVYAEVWERAAAAVQDADLVILFGTDHYGSDPFTLTRQSYATPYGVLPTATAIVDQLAAVVDAAHGPGAAFAGELRHIAEHSLELVAVWLHHLRDRRPVEVVPILVGGFHRFYLNGGAPHHDPLIDQVIATLREATVGRKVVAVASGDLAHVGPAFSQPPLDERTRAVVQAADQTLIQHMAAGDATAFYQAIHRIQDRHNVCGVAPIYLTLRYLGEVEGTPAGYLACPADEQNTSAVTIGGMVFQG
jgi:AmmeMemoRadiSam system protein B